MALSDKITALRRRASKMPSGLGRSALIQLIARLLEQQSEIASS